MSVSYLITLYNKEAFVGAVVDSVLEEHKQTGGEVIIYDDASTDRSAEIVRDRLAAHPDRAGALRLMRGDKNRGVAAATNEVINAATQPYTRIVDADDVLVKGSTVHLLRFLKQHDLGFIHGMTTEKGDNDQNLEQQPFAECFVMDNPLRRILRRGFAGTSPSMFPTSELRKVTPLPEWKRRTQDFLIILRMASRKARMGYINDIVAVGPPADRKDAHLSASLAAMFAEMNRDVVNESKHLSLADLRYASRRYASRTSKYFRRRGQSKLSRAEQFALWCWQNLAWLASRQGCIEHLTRAADLLDRDRHVVILD